MYFWDLIEDKKCNEADSRVCFNSGQMLLLNARWLFSEAPSECFVIPRETKTLAKDIDQLLPGILDSPPPDWSSTFPWCTFPTDCFLSKSNPYESLSSLDALHLIRITLPSCYQIEINVSRRQPFSCCQARSRSTYISWRDMTIISETRWNGDDFNTRPRPT